MSTPLPSRSYHLLSLGLSTLLLALCLPSTATADPLESRAWLGLGASAASPATVLSQWGPSAQLGMNLKFGTFLSAYGGIDGAYHFGLDDPEASPVIVSDAFLGLRYDLDILAYIPYLGLAAMAYLNSPPTEALPDLAAAGPLGAGVKLTLGMDWRPRREWSLGGLVEIHTAFSDLSKFGLYATVGMNVGYHWRW